MPGKLILSLAFCVLALSHGCSGNRRLQQRRHICDIKRLTATEPHLAMKDEAGVTEIWDYQTPEFLCAGIVAVRLVLHPGGLVLPSYNTAPFLSFVLQGRGVQGVVVPGCPNTFQSETETESESPRGGEKRDHHQKLFRSSEGDVISSPADVLQWIYNDGDTDYVCITLFDTKSFHNQLDRKVRSFFIAGKSQQSREYSRINGGNIFSGFDKEILREVFPGVEYETIHKIQAQDDERGSIVLAPDLQLQIPEESQQGEHGVNGVEESLCNLKFTHNLNNSSQSDYLDRCAGRINTVNGNALPILQFLRLSAAHVVLYKNAVLGPQWMVNAHSAVYVTKGDGRFSVVNDEGNAMFDDVVQKGQILVIPQGFAVAAKAGGEGLEWVEMRTNDDAVISAVAGRNSVLGAIPAEVLANAFDISREQAVRLKNGSQEIGICRPFGESSEREQHDVV